MQDDHDPHYRKAPSCSFKALKDGAHPACPTCLAEGIDGCGALDPEIVEELARYINIVHVDSHAVLFLESEPATRIYFIVDGVAASCKYREDGRRQIVGFLYPRDILGVPNLEVYSSTVEAVTPLELCSFPRTAFEAIRHKYQAFSDTIMHVVSNELIEAQEHMLLLGRAKGSERVAAFLARYFDSERSHGGDKYAIRLPMRRADIADYLGMSMENVSREFRALERAGVIAMEEPTAVTIKAPGRLLEMAVIEP